MAELTVLIVPEALKHKRVVQQHPDVARESLPDQFLKRVPLIQFAQFVEENLEGFLFAEAQAFVNFRGVGGVEGDS